MRNLILFSLLLASAFQTALGEQFGDWTYTVSNNQATITGYTGAGGAVTIPSEVNGIPVLSVGNGSTNIFGWGNTSVTSLTIPTSVKNIGSRAFFQSRGLTSITFSEGIEIIEASAFAYNNVGEITLPRSLKYIGVQAFTRAIYQNYGGYTELIYPPIDRVIMPEHLSGYLVSMSFYIDDFNITRINLPRQVNIISSGIEDATNTNFINALANNDAFVTAVANKIKATGGNYGLSVKSELETLATKSGLSSAIEPLATKSELTSALTESKTAGVNSVLSNPNLWTLYTTSQIQNMAVGDLVLTRQVSGGFVLNYDIEQSADLQTWTPYQALSLPLTGLPTDKAFVRIKMINSSPNPPLSTASGSNL